MAILVKSDSARNFEEFFWRWIGSSEPARAHHEVCFGQKGKVGRSSRATIVNETLDFGLPAAVVEDIASASAVIVGRFPATVVTMCGLALLSLLLVVAQGHTTTERGHQWARGSCGGFEALSFVWRLARRVCGMITTSNMSLSSACRVGLASARGRAHRAGACRVGLSTHRTSACSKWHAAACAEC